MSKADEIEKSIKKLKYMADFARDVWIKQEEAKAIDTVLAELEKKDKIIDKMSEALTTPIHGKEWVKEYFEKEVSEENARNR